MTEEEPALEVRDLGMMAYGEALQVQLARVEVRAENECNDALLFVEHPAVITLGRSRASLGHVVAPGETPVVQVERGGDATWHGPGQLVGYPIVALREGERDVHEVLRRLEGALMEAARGWGLQPERVAGATGVWARGPRERGGEGGLRKIASIGIAVRRWVTFHGFALNIDCDLNEFRRIVPCGLSADVMGSVASLGGRVPGGAQLRAEVAAAVARALGRRLVG